MVRSGWLVLIAAAGVALVVGLLLGAAGVAALRAAFIGWSFATVMCYGYDKHAARAGGQRVPELVLHILSAAGGTPGAFAGQLLFRHKTRSARFQAVFWTIAAVQAAVLLIVFHARGG